MNKSALYINNAEVPVVRDIAISISYLIANLRYPDTRNSSFTRTILLPSVAELDKVFEFCFEVNIALQSFNPNLKTPISYRVNNTEVLSGNLQLTKMIVNKQKKSTVYECVINGFFSDLFFNIGENYLTGNTDSSKDIDFSEYDHILNYANVTNTWDPSVIPNTNRVNGSNVAVVAGIGYRYPLIDYGLNNGDVGEYYAHHQRPMLFAYEYLLKIFEKAGKTFTSDFLESAFFKSKGVPCVDFVKVPQADINNRRCQAGTIGGINPINFNLILAAGEWDQGTGGLASPSYPVFDDDSTQPNHDVANIYNLANGEITIPVTSQYTIRFSMSIVCTIFWDLGLAASVDSKDVYCATYIERWNGSVWTSVASGTPFTGSGPGGANIIDVYQSAEYTEIAQAGWKYRLRIETLGDNIIARDNLGAVIVTGTLSYSVFVNQTLQADVVETKFTCDLTSDNIFDGDTLEVNRAIPSKIKQRDFLKGIINHFNLYLDIDKDDPDNYIIEPREDFYTDDEEDWTNKLDAGKDIEIVPMSEVSFKRLKIKYKSDTDYYNKSYEEAYKITYGEGDFESENEFISSDKVIEVVFSPTPLVGNDENRLIIPKIYKNESGTVSHQKANIRLLHWGGYIQQDPLFRLWTFRDMFGNSQTPFGYPYAGHLDDPYDPTYDLNFGVPREVYYILKAGTNYPTNNSMSVYHLPMLEQMDNKDSKMMVGYFVLSELDIKKFDFRKRYRVESSLYRVSSINDFDIMNERSTKCELIKIV